MKKRLLVYLSVLIGCVFIGMTTFLLVKSYEYISVTADTGNEIYLNIKETETLDIVHNNPSEDTELSATISDEKVISFNLETGVITALKGGQATLTINSTNEDFELLFERTIYVGDGSSSTTPYYIKTASDLEAIGGTRTYSETISQQWGLSSYYKLVNNIDLSETEWTAIGSSASPFKGQLFGDNKTINNLTITEDAECAGLFAYISDLAVVDSVKFSSVNINGAFDYCGVVAGVSSGATISRIEIVSATISTAPRLFDDEEDNNLTKAYSMVGGIVGCCDIECWEEPDSEFSDYGYTRTTITMCSFTGTIGANADCLAIAPTADKMYMAYGGIVGFDLGSTILNNKAEVIFNFSSDFATLTKNTTDTITLSVEVGGIIGLIVEEDIEDETTTVVNTIYPIVKNNLAILTFDNLTDTYGGIIGSCPLTVQYISGKQYTPGKQWVIGNYFYSDNKDLTFGGCNNTDFPNATVSVSTLSALKKQATYIVDSTESWDMGTSISVWSITEDESIPEINFNGIEQSVTFDNEIYTISTVAEFKKYYDKMTSSTSSAISKKFWLSQSYILNTDINLAEAEITEWIPIGYDFTFMGIFDGNGHKLYYSNDTTSIISFINTKDEQGNYEYRYGGIFAVINSNAEVKNLTIEGLNISYAEYAGGIAGVNSGAITNCHIKDIEIQDGICVGFVVGFNYGRIQNTETVEETNIVYTVSTSALNKIGISDSANTVYVGGITGYNSGVISSIKISGAYTIIGETTENDVIRVYGCAVGYNKGEITDCAIEQGCLSDNSKVRIYLGGFCGINDGTIKTSYTGGYTLETSDEGGDVANVYQTTVISDINLGNQVAGGFVAYLGYDGTIEKCFANVSVKGYYAAGLAADLLGTASECYVKGSVTGEFIGGFACNLAFKSNNAKGGTLSNSYNTVSLTGISANSISAGLAVFIRTPGKIEYCYIANSFSGLGEKYFESYTNTRFTLQQKATAKISPANALGTINNIVINSGDIDVEDSEDVISNQTYFSDNNQVVYYLKNSDCLLGKTAYETAGFSVGPTAYWTIEESFPPILTNLNLDNIPQIIVEESVE